MDFECKSFDKCLKDLISHAESLKGYSINIEQNSNIKSIYFKKDAIQRLRIIIPGDGYNYNYQIAVTVFKDWKKKII